MEHAGEPERKLFRNPCQRPQKGRRAMQLFPHSAPIPLEMNADRKDSSRQRADLAYQMVTVAAMLLLLGSLWVF